VEHKGPEVRKSARSRPGGTWGNKKDEPATIGRVLGNTNAASKRDENDVEGL